jgi:molybdate transport system substrate-binding protein
MIVPQDFYAPIRQDAIILNRGMNDRAVAAFVSFLRSSRAATIIERGGYVIDSSVPDTSSE